MKDSTIIAEFKKLQNANNQNADRIEAQHRLMNSTMVLLKNYNARLETLQEMLIDNKILDGAQFELICDTKLGLRLLAAEENIKIGDVAWIEYEARIDGNLEATDVIPVRVGSNAVVFEPTIVGKTPNSEGHQHTAKYAEGPNAGKEIIFSFKIGKVKRKLVEGVVADGPTGEPVTELTPEVVEQLAREAAAATAAINGDAGQAVHEDVSERAGDEHARGDGAEAASDVPADSDGSSNGDSGEQLSGDLQP